MNADQDLWSGIAPPRPRRFLLCPWVYLSEPLRNWPRSQKRRPSFLFVTRQRRRAMRVAVGAVDLRAAARGAATFEAAAGIEFAPGGAVARAVSLWLHAALHGQRGPRGTAAREFPMRNRCQPGGAPRPPVASLRRPRIARPARALRRKTQRNQLRACGTGGACGTGSSCRYRGCGRPLPWSATLPGAPGCGLARAPRCSPDRRRAARCRRRACRA
jgi:hypothetical protein